MNFVSLEYLVLFSLVFALYYTLKRFQIAILLVASLFFYGWEEPIALPLLLLVSFVSSAITYLLMKRWTGDAKLLLALGITINLLILAFFKYKFLFVDVGKAASPGEGLFMTLLYLPLPIGISFYTFHCISLLGDAYRGYYVDKTVADGRRGLLAYLSRGLLYLVFFPQIVAGPIVKAHQFMPQIGVKHLRDVPFAEAARWIIWGLFFKAFVADNIGQFTIWMEYPHFLRLGRVDYLILLMAFSFQIFADFAGYSALALGSAALLGYRLPVNFDRPYIASSFSDFWRRWHISLSSFLREYLYIPLGGNRKGPLRTYVNLLLTMGLGGLWHGAALSFLFWGLMHGAALAIERMLSPLARMVPKARLASAALSHLYVGLVFIVVSCLWLFFKLQDFSVAKQFVDAFLSAERNFRLSSAQYLLVACYALPVMIHHHLPRRASEGVGPWAAAVYGLMLFLAIFEKGPTDAFIYFQF